MAMFERTTLSTEAPSVEKGMSRDLDFVLNHTNYILREDVEWNRQHFVCCETHRKYNIHTSSRTLTEDEKRFPLREVKDFPIVFQVREQYNHCNTSEAPLFGVFHPDVADSPTWPTEAPELQWKEHPMYSTNNAEICILRLS